MGVFRQNKKTLNENWHIAEIVFALTGVFILISVVVIYFSQDFVFWNIAKAFYGIGVILVLKYT